MKVIAELPVKETLRRSLLGASGVRKVNVNGRSFSVANLKVFAVHGCKCVRCGREGNRIVAWENKGGGIHVDLYSKDTMMNRDHIIPKSKKGPNCDWNYQPMCIKCNTKKGNNETSHDRELAKFRAHWKKIHIALYDGYWKVVPKCIRFRWLLKFSLGLRDTHLHKFTHLLARLTA